MEAKPKLKLKLIVQLSLITGIVLLFTSVLISYFNITTVKSAFLQSAVSDLDHLSETIFRAVYHQMLKNDRNQIQVTISEMGNQKGIERIRILNHEGLTAFSTDQADIGELVYKKNSPSCVVCHGDNAILEQTGPLAQSRMFLDNHGKQVLGFIRPIYNEKTCWTGSCHAHAPDSRFLGLLDITISANPMLTLVKDYRWQAVVQIMLLIISAALCLTLLSRKLIIQPVHTLLEHTRAVSRGQWRRLRSLPGAELGELAEAFNEMTSKLQANQREKDQWAETLEQRVESRTREIKKMQSVLVRSEKLASLGQLVAGIAHELNNPLTGIMIHVSLIADNRGLPDELVEDCKTVMYEAGRCSKIVKELLDFARASDSERSLQPLPPVINRTVALIEHNADFREIEIVREEDPALPSVMIDASQIEQVLVNMLINAGQAMPEGGRILIKTAIQPGGEAIIIRIEDNGCGIAEVDREKLFDPFFSTKGHQGTGLGLSVSYGIVQAHGGDIQVESCLGKGTAFTIFLPLVNVPAD